MSNSMRKYIWLFAGAGLWLSAQTAYAQFPALSSDGEHNTGLGTNALSGLSSCEPSSCPLGNTTVGYNGLTLNSAGAQNTSMGSFAGYGITGSHNTALGNSAMDSNGLTATGSWNTAVGASALLNPTSASYDTSVGYGAMSGISVGTYNVAIGYEALPAVEDVNANSGAGVTNTIAIGAMAMTSNTDGVDNVVVGTDGMYSNTLGSSNVALGNAALYSNIDGSGNFALGTGAMYQNTHGCYNTAVGSDALYNLSGGSSGCSSTGAASNNIAIGISAGYSVTAGSNNIDIASTGSADDKGVLRIGTQGQMAAAYVQGIYNVALSGLPVYVSSSGQLGIQGSSQRYKTDIRSMSELSARLEQLRPVTFHYRQDPTRALQYGLIAEEVAQVFPELVVRDEKGKILGVHYDELAPILLKQVQMQAVQIAQLKRDGQKMASLERKLEQLEQRMVRLQTRDAGDGTLIVRNVTDMH